MSVKIRNKMSPSLTLLFCVCTFFISSNDLTANSQFALKLEDETRVDNDEIIFSYIKSVCEDDEENFYVLDPRVKKVFKFSAKGKFLLDFGRPGRGPGDFAYPYEIFFSTDKKIVVTEMFNVVSYFSKNGKFLHKRNFAKSFNSISDLYYAGDGHFCGHVSGENPDISRQVIFNEKTGAILQSLYESELPLISIPLEDGGNRVFGIPFGECTPKVMFSYYNGISAAAFNRKYEITVLNSQGKLVSKISAPVTPSKFSSKEIKRHKRIIKEQKWPDQAKLKIKKILPKTRNILNFIYVAGDNIFVFLTPKDITKKKPIYPVDMYTINGELIGTTKADFFPYLVTKKYMYLVKYDDDEGSILSRYKYRLVKK